MLSPYRARAARARHLFVASLQDGEFPGGDTGDPLLGDERRAAPGHRGARRGRTPASEERYLFHACACRPTERLWLSLAKLRRGGPPRNPVAVRRRRPRPARPGARGGRGEAEAGPRPGPRRLRALGGARRPRARALPGRPRAAGRARSFRARSPTPGCSPSCGERDPVGPGTIEKWIECPYRWFVDHELKPQRLEPQPDHLTAGSIVHKVLERLYSGAARRRPDPPPGRPGRWRRRAAAAARGGGRAAGAASPACPLTRILIARMRAQIERLLDREAAGETELRPALLEASFGDEAATREGRRSTSVGCRHPRPDRPRGHHPGSAASASSTTTRPAPRCGRRRSSPRRESSSSSSTPARLRDLWEIEPIGGLYHPLGARDDPRPRGFVADRRSRPPRPSTSPDTDRLEHDDVQEALDAGESRRPGRGLRRCARARSVATRTGAAARRGAATSRSAGWSARSAPRRSRATATQAGNGAG